MAGGHRRWGGLTRRCLPVACLIALMALPAPEVGGRLPGGNRPATGAVASTPVPAGPATPAPSGSERLSAPPQVEWTFRSAVRLTSPPAMTDGTIFVGDDDGYVYAVRGGSGIARWGVATGGRVLTPPVPAGGTLFVASGTFTAVDIDSGRPMLQVTSDRRQINGIAVGSGIAIGAGLRREDGFVEAIDATTSVALWRVDLDGAVYGPPFLHDGVVYVGSMIGEVIAFEATTGERQWYAQAPGAVVPPVAIAGDGIAVASWDRSAAGVPGRGGAVQLLDAATGQLRWRTPIAAPVGGSPVVAGDDILAAGGNTLYAVARTDGAIRWSAQLPDEISATPALDGETILVGCRDGTLLGLDRLTGSERWRVPLGGEILGTVAGRQSIYVVADGILVALSLSND